MKRLVQFLGLGCSHQHIGWPRREKDGKDYVMCHDCQRLLLSAVQADLPPPRLTAPGRKLDEPVATPCGIERRWMQQGGVRW